MCFLKIKYVKYTAKKVGALPHISPRQNIIASGGKFKPGC